jgi:hypothetical protein
MALFGRVLRTGLSSLRDRAAARLAALRFNPSRWRPFVRRHAALIVCAGLAAPIILIDRVFDLHALAMVLAIYLAFSMADAWDTETQ